MSKRIIFGEWEVFFWFRRETFQRWSGQLVRENHGQNIQGIGGENFRLWEFFLKTCDTHSASSFGQILLLLAAGPGCLCSKELLQDFLPCLASPIGPLLCAARKAVLGVRKYFVHWKLGGSRVHTGKLRVKKRFGLNSTNQWKEAINS